MSEQESASSTYHVCQFSGQTDTFDFLTQICPKIDFGVGISKNLSANSGSAPPRDHVGKFSVKKNNFEVFDLN